MPAGQLVNVGEGRMLGEGQWNAKRVQWDGSVRMESLFRALPPDLLRAWGGVVAKNVLGVMNVAQVSQRRVFPESTVEEGTNSSMVSNVWFVSRDGIRGRVLRLSVKTVQSERRQAS